MKTNAFIHKKKNIPSQPKSSASRQKAFQLKDQRPEAAAQRQLIKAENSHSEKSAQLKSTARGGVIQRYSIVNPNDYQIHDDGQKPMFPSNQMDSMPDNMEQDQVTYHFSKRNWVKRYIDNPPLKVSENGMLALESTVGQPQVFYGESSKVQNFAQRLTNIKSRITLAEEPGASVTVPKDPLNPQGAVENLVRVKPVLSPHMDPNDALMDTSVCSYVSSRIVGGKNLVTGGRVGNEKVHEPIFVANGPKFGAILNQMNDQQTTEGFEDRWQDESPISTNINNLPPISPRIDTLFEPGFFGIRARPSDKILRALSKKEVPQKLIDQVYKIYNNDKTVLDKYTESDVFDHIFNYFKIENTIRYGTTRTNEGLMKKVGINEMTAPEVGESFSTIGLSSPGTTDEKGFSGDIINLTSMTNPEIKKILKEFLALQSNSKRLGLIAKSQYQNARRLVQFEDHHAAVVARDEADTVTFENYNRGEEYNLFVDEIWSDWFSGEEEFNDNVNSEVREMLQNIRLEEQNPGYDNSTRMKKSLQKKKETLEKFSQDFVTITSQVRNKFESNILTEQNNLWHFNMYGPAGKTFIDENGQESAQSFHEVWSNSVPNNLTVRTTGLMDPEMRKDLEQKAANVAYYSIIASNFTRLISDYSSDRDQLKRLIEVPQRRIEYSETVEYLKTFDGAVGTLSPQEEMQARILFDDEEELISNELSLLKELDPQNPKTLFFEQFMDVFFSR